MCVCAWPSTYGRVLLALAEQRCVAFVPAAAAGVAARGSVRPPASITIGKVSSTFVKAQQRAHQDAQRNHEQLEKLQEAKHHARERDGRVTSDRHSFS